MKNVLFLATALLVLGGCSKYKKEGNDIWYESWNANKGTYRLYLQNADAATFKILVDGVYAKDKNQAYYESEVIAGAAPASFECLSHSFARDTKHGFYKNKIIAGSQGASFAVISGYYARDQHAAYYESEPISGSHPATFVVVDGVQDVAKDDHQYYRHAHKIPVRDYATFKTLEHGFATDKYQVYYLLADPEEMVLTGVDAATFSVNKNGLGQDKHGCHDGTKRVPCQ